MVTKKLMYVLILVKLDFMEIKTEYAKPATLNVLLVMDNIILIVQVVEKIHSYMKGHVWKDVQKVTTILYYWELVIAVIARVELVLVNGSFNVNHVKHNFISI